MVSDRVVLAPTSALGLGLAEAVDTLEVGMLAAAPLWKRRSTLTRCVPAAHLPMHCPVPSLSFWARSLYSHATVPGLRVFVLAAERSAPIDRPSLRAALPSYQVAHLQQQAPVALSVEVDLAAVAAALARHSDSCDSMRVGRRQRSHVWVISCSVPSYWGS